MIVCVPCQTAVVHLGAGFMVIPFLCQNPQKWQSMNAAKISLHERGNANGHVDFNLHPLFYFYFLFFNFF